MRTNNTLRTIEGRGEFRQTRGGAYGWYVGTTTLGVEWWSYNGGTEFARMCEAFDKSQ